MTARGVPVIRHSTFMIFLLALPRPLFAPRGPGGLPLPRNAPFMLLPLLLPPPPRPPPAGGGGPAAPNAPAAPGTPAAPETPDANRSADSPDANTPASPLPSTEE